MLRCEVLQVDFFTQPQTCKRPSASRNGFSAMEGASYRVVYSMTTAEQMMNPNSYHNDHNIVLLVHTHCE